VATGKVLLAALPFAPVNYPSLALGLLKAAVARLGIACDVRYFSLDYLDRAGAEAFERLTDSAHYSSLLGEWVFATAAHGEADRDDLDYFTEVFSREAPDAASASDLMTFLAARENAGAFIDDCLDAVDWRDYAVVGFTTSFQQNMASLALARRIKERVPDILIVFGGANCQDEMGIELHRNYPFIDAVCLGEADIAFPELVRRHLAGDEVGDISGMVTRRNGETALPSRAMDPIEDLDSLPYPDLGDFYEQHARSPVASAHYTPAVVLETSRGCWWGAKHHCTFCGINGLAMAYRSKSQRRAYDELSYLASRHGSDFVSADTILDMRYFDEFLPRLAREGPNITMYFQMKANLRPEQLTLLARAGIKKIQPGIESLSTRLLALMDKGCTMLQNVQALKLAAENGLYVQWNLLYGFPGESAADYAEMARLMPKLRHLQPPGTMGRARADRFSPYFARPETFSVTLAAAGAYRFLYPFDDESIRRLAYHFEMRSPQLDAVDEIIAGTEAEYALWQDHVTESALYCTDLGDGVDITDARWGWQPATWLLEGAEAAVHRLCWKMTPRHAIAAELHDRFGAAAIERALAALIERGLLLHEPDTYLALALRQPGFRRAPSWAEIRAARVVPYALRVPERSRCSSAP
jgi:ribosomal peptide maturation radical SAM protein 1